MKKKQSHIHQFELSSAASAGIAIKNLQEWRRKNEHDIHTPHRDNHYLLAVITQGKGKFNLDFEELVLSAPLLLFVFPEQVHHILESEDLHGWALSFDPSLANNEF